MCRRVHLSALRLHVARRAHACWSCARTGFVRGRLFRRFQEWFLAERFARKSKKVSQLSYQTRSPANGASSRSRGVHRVTRTPQCVSPHTRAIRTRCVFVHGIDERMVESAGDVRMKFAKRFCQLNRPGLSDRHRSSVQPQIILPRSSVGRVTDAGLDTCTG